MHYVDPTLDINFGDYDASSFATAEMQQLCEFRIAQDSNECVNLMQRLGTVMNEFVRLTGYSLAAISQHWLQGAAFTSSGVNLPTSIQPPMTAMDKRSEYREYNLNIIT